MYFNSIMTNIPAPVENTIWVNPHNQSCFWAPNVLEFYYDGDSTCCYTTYMGRTPLNKEWWGGILGYCGSGYLQKTVNINLTLHVL